MQYNSIITNIGSAYKLTDCSILPPPQTANTCSHGQHLSTTTAILTPPYVKNGLAILYEAVGHLSSDAKGFHISDCSDASVKRGSRLNT